MVKHCQTMLCLLIATAISTAFAEDAQRLEERVVGAGTDGVIGIEALRPDHLERQMTDNIEDSVRYIPGVQVNDSGSRFNDDGFNIRGLEGDYVAVSVDGVDQGETLNPPSFAPYGMFGSSRGAIEVETVKAVRLTKGANSVTDGSGALAGSVVYETKDPGDFLEPEGDDRHIGIKTAYDSRSDETLVSATLANRAGIFEGLMVITLREGSETEAHGSGDDILGPARGQADPLDRVEQSLLAKANFALSENFTIGFVIESITREAQVIPLSRDSTHYYAFFADDTNDRDRFGVRLNWTDLSVVFADEIEFRADYQELYTRGITSFGYSAFTPPLNDDFLRTEDRSFDQESTEYGLDLIKSFDTGSLTHSLVYGFEVRNGSGQNSLFDIRRATLSPTSAQTDFIVDPTWVPQTDTDRLSVYIRDEIVINETWNAFVGLRYDNTEYDPEVSTSFTDPTGDTVNAADFGAATGEVGLSWEFLPNHRVAASVGQGFKAPTLQDLYLGVSSEQLIDVGTGQTFTDYDEISNPNLDPERSTNYEVAYEYSTPDTLIRLTGFVSIYDELIQNTTDTIPYLQPFTYLSCGRRGCNPVTVTEDEIGRARNVGSVDLHGFELDSRFLFSERWSMNFAYSHVKGEHNNQTEDPTVNGFRSGDVLATAAPDSATLGLNYDAPNRKWGGSLFVVWTEEKDEDADASLTSLNNGEGVFHYPDGWVTVDLFAFYQFEAYDLRLSAGVRNLLDEDYIRWEVINNVRPTSPGFGFFGGAEGQGYERFSDPGRSFSLSLTLEL